MLALRFQMRVLMVWSIEAGYAQQSHFARVDEVLKKAGWNVLVVADWNQRGDAKPSTIF